jgi:hypothetical protein
MAKLRGEEAWAQAMISAELGLPVEKHDEGSFPGMYDLMIDPKGRCGAVEVTACTDPESTETWNLMNGGGDVWVVDGLSGGWLVTVFPSSRVQQLKAELPTLLRGFEAAGITNLDQAGAGPSLPGSSPSPSGFASPRRIRERPADQGAST